ncbi:galactose-binding domain-like protein [Xylogone sp. PMI_703]|nr:galactose-binding domain-like protein [Xylogone sp. PMI_703]
MRKTAHGSLAGYLTFHQPSVPLPDLTKLTWRSHDSILELEDDYDDSPWVSANRTSSPNGARAFTTPTDLYAGDYGFHVGAITYRGHFIATGNETAFNLTINGGNSFGFSVWVDGTFLGSYTGVAGKQEASQSFPLKQTLEANQLHVITVLTENTGYNENDAGGVTYPRGILGYSFTGASPPIRWKYADIIRGPANEGGFLQSAWVGWHLPNPPVDAWSYKSLLQGVATPGVEIFVAKFALNLPEGYDVPLSITLKSSSDSRAHLLINGYKFGLYTQNIGPQTVFPVPEGIINHRGKNSIAIITWNLASNGGRLTQLSLNATGVYQTGYGKVLPAPQPAYSARAGAY